VVSQLEQFDHQLRFGKRNGAANMNLLFYGPPGSGKSELAKFIAQRLDREVLCRRVSDLQSHYVGASEKNIKRAFAEAEAGEALLVIDEADSLLFSRDRAHHSWEISFTNEFLTQMERFQGILICTTNRLTDLDEASLRRFSYKIGFHALKPEGNLIFYERMLASLAGSPFPVDARERLFQITDLCPGDFKVVRDRFAFWPQTDLHHDMLIDALAEEARTKNLHKGKKLVGF
jgi:transitional endoplasmic reticulum ATPase